MASSSTRVLKCDPASIVFNSLADQPEIQSIETQEALREASVSLVEKLRPVAFPTETVYGLGAVAQNSTAVSRIFSTKGRPSDNPLIVHVSSLAMLQTLLPSNYTPSAAYQALIKHFWPGALTLLFPRNPDLVPDIITANQPTVAVRMPSHPVAMALIATANVPLAAPSANSSGKPSPTRAEHVLHDLGGKVDIILDGGACEVGLESTVVDGLKDDEKIRILRPGGITVEEIERVLREEMKDFTRIPQVLVHRRDFHDEGLEQAPSTPGMKYRHYSPSIPVTLIYTTPPPDAIPSMSFSSLITTFKAGGSDKIGILAATDSVLWSQVASNEGFQWLLFPLGPASQPSVIAHRLFDGLLTLEQQGAQHILIEAVEERNEGLAIMNRVRKAAGDVRWIALP